MYFLIFFAVKITNFPCMELPYLPIVSKAWVSYQHACEINISRVSVSKQLLISFDITILLNKIIRVTQFCWIDFTHVEDIKFLYWPVKVEYGQTDVLLKGQIDHWPVSLLVNQLVESELEHGDDHEVD